VSRWNSQRSVQTKVIVRTHTHLHWLRIVELVEFKATVLVYQVLHGQAPHYLGRLTRVAETPIYLADWHSVLLVPTVCTCHVRLSTIGSRAFPVAGPHVWNNLPEHCDFCRLSSYLPQQSKNTSNAALILFILLMFVLSLQWSLQRFRPIHLGHFKNWLIDWLIDSHTHTYTHTHTTYRSIWITKVVDNGNVAML